VGSPGRFRQIDSVWAPVRKKLKRLREERAARIEAGMKKLARQAGDPNATEAERGSARMALQVRSLFHGNRFRGSGLSMPSARALRSCAVCTGEFFGHGKVWACTDACARERRKSTRSQGKPRVRRVKHEPRPCEFCETLFTPRRVDARFHSARCRVAQHRREAEVEK
jgi:hypothetical protein